MITIEIPDDISKKELSINELPVNWRNFPHPSSTQKIGDEFVQENKYAILIIPSVVTIGDFNILINPNHKDFNKISISSIEEFPFDQRIFK